MSAGAPGRAAPGGERAMMIRARATTDPAHGHRPHARPMDEHLRLGVVNLDKPAGPTSHQVVAWIKEGLHLEKAGHGGTLDPGVTGVLPVALLDATRVVKTLLESPKEYVAVVETHRDVSEDDLVAALRSFEGAIYQVPPTKSAVARRVRVRHVYALDILETGPRHALFRVSCEAGTYIRKLCHDVGVVLGGGAHMRDLRRTKSGPFTEDASVTLHDLRDAYVFWQDDGDESFLRQVVRPLEELLTPLRRVVVRDSAVDALCHGADLAVPGVVEVERGTEPGDPTAVFTLKGEAVAVGKAAMGAEDVVVEKSGIAVDTDRVVMEPGTYPRGW